MLAVVLVVTAGAPAAQPPRLSGEATVSLLTMLPGDEVYSLFGHSAIRIRDPLTGFDVAYNYGTFNFEQPGFVVRFARGRLDYILDTAPYSYEVDRYRHLQRPIIEQRLDLDSATVGALFSRLEINALPENRAYRYRFFHDNCSTRLLEIIDIALSDAGRPALALPGRSETESFRDLIRPYGAGTPLLWTGMSAGLGIPADSVASTRQRSFLPLELMRLADAITVEGRSLVASRDTVFWIPGAGTAPPAFPWPTILGWAICVAVGVATAIAWRTPRRYETALRRLDVTLLAVAGVVGVVLGLLWLATEHGVTGPNLHLIWAWPTHVAAAVAIARRRRWRPYLLGAGAVALVAAAGWPFWPQGMPAALLPFAILVAVRCLARGAAPAVPDAVGPPTALP